MANPRTRGPRADPDLLGHAHAPRADEAERAASGGEGSERGISRGSLLDHANRDGVDGFASIVGGKLTTYRPMAEAVTDLVCERFGVAKECRTASASLAGADDPKQLEAFVAQFDAAGSADADPREKQISLE